MAEAKQIHVQVNRFAVKDIFDDKLQAKAVSFMQKTCEAAIKGNLAKGPPKGKGAKGWSLDGSIVSLGPDKAGRNLEAKVSLTISTWPGKSIKSMLSTAGATKIQSADKIDWSDVEFILKDTVGKAMVPAIRYMEGNAP